MINFTSKSMGRCLTEYRRTDLEQILPQCKKFFVISQFESRTNPSPEGRNVYPDFNLMTGFTTYGIRESDGMIMELGSIIDSSD